MCNRLSNREGWSPFSWTNLRIGWQLRPVLTITRLPLLQELSLKIHVTRVALHGDFSPAYLAAIRKRRCLLQPQMGTRSLLPVSKLKKRLRRRKGSSARSLVLLKETVTLRVIPKLIPKKRTKLPPGSRKVVTTA